jgi:arabinofuranosyltransferase
MLLAERLLLGAGGLLFVLLTHYHWQQIADDVFIVLRVADNVVAGWGPVWNRGERVEAYSSPLWLGILVLVRRAGLPLPAAAGVVGIFCSALCLFGAWRLALVAGANRFVAAAAGGGTALVYPLYFWAPAGLETALVAALVTWAAAGMLGSLDSSRWQWCIPAGLLGVARPEGPLVALALVGLVALVRGRSVLRWSSVAVALTPAVAWLLFRRSYYGVWLPNPYYAKATGALATRMEAGAIYAFPALALGGVTAVAVGLGGADRRLVSVLLFVALLVAIVVGGGGDWMWHGRLLLPAILLLVPLAVAAVARLAGPRRIAAAVACIVAGAGFLPSLSLLADAAAFHRMPPTAYQEGTMVPAAMTVASYIASKYPADALIAVNHAGALPYALPNPVLDMTGLADAHIARDLPGGLHQKFDARYVLSRQPRLIVLNTRVRPGTAGAWYQPGYWAGETALVNQPDFAMSYRPVETFWTWRWQAVGESYIVLYERKE